MAVATNTDVSETLAWEAENRARAGYAALAAGVLLFATFLFAIVGFSGSPSVTLTDGLRDAVGQAPTGGNKGLLTARAMWYQDNGVVLIIVTLLSAIGTALIAMVLGFLFRATAARRPKTARIILGMGLVGPILYGLGPLVSVVTVVIQSENYVSNGVFSTLGAHDAVATGSGIVFAQVFVLIGQIATAAAIVFTSLWAMQTGLLTRFLGILGIIVGALLLLPAFFGPPAIIQSFWLIALGLMVIGRVGVTPPAWAAGVAIPWPSQQQLREERDGGARPEDEPEPEEVEDTEPDAAGDAFGTASASAKKRKRKRR